MAVLQHNCKCGSEQVTMAPAGGGRGTGDSTFYTGECGTCGFSIEHLPENSDGKISTAIRDWNRMVRGVNAQRSRKLEKTQSSTPGPATVRCVSNAEVPAECRSPAPDLLRSLAQRSDGKIDAAGQKLLLDTAAEIEGAEDAYAVLVGEIRSLREKLAHTERNLRATIELVPRTVIS